MNYDGRSTYISSGSLLWNVWNIRWRGAQVVSQEDDCWLVPDFQSSTQPRSICGHNFCGSQIRETVLILEVSHAIQFNSHTFPAPLPFFAELGVLVLKWRFVGIGLDQEDWRIGDMGLGNRELR
jgi:hypothetical protein